VTQPRKRSSSKKRSTSRKTAASPSAPPESPAGDGSTSSSGSSASPLGLTGKSFKRPEQGGAPRAATARDLNKPEYEPPASPPVEWTPQRAEVVVKGFGYVVHALDPVASSPLAPDLWKLTEEDAKAIAEPLSRIANRYATLRGAAGFSDEIGVGAALAPYVKRNLAERGRVKAAHARLDRQDAHAPAYERSEPETPAPEPPSPPVSQPVSQPVSEPEPGPADPAGPDEQEQAPKLGVADAFLHALPVEPAHLPPHETERG